MGRFFRRIWLVVCDHSVAAVKRTKREAEAAVRLRRRGANHAEHRVVGPYVLQERSR
jgi:hypothetical protein